MDSTRSIRKWQYELLGPVLLRRAEPHRPLPLAAHGEDRVDGGEDAQPGLAEVVLQALEDERRVEGVRLHDRRLQGQDAALSPWPLLVLGRGCATATWMPGRPL